MNLKEEVERYKVYRDDVLLEGMIGKKYAIAIAKQYAEEMCKVQKQICADNLKTEFKKYKNMGFEKFMEEDTYYSWEIALNAPLATEE